MSIWIIPPTSFACQILLGKVGKEVVVQYYTNTPQQFDVNVFPPEYIVNIGSFTMNLFRQPTGSMTL
jgi:hypothetical protein